MNLYMYILKAFELLQENGMIIIKDIHEHDNNHDYAEVVTIYDEEKGVRLVTGLSGGKQEAVWNTYECECDTFMDAFTRVVDINNVVELADAIYTIFKFEKRRKRVSFSELCELDSQLTEYCNQVG